MSSVILNWMRLSPYISDHRLLLIDEPDGQESERNRDLFHYQPLNAVKIPGLIFKMTDVGDNSDEQRDEVRKLQDLVEKLEKQNELLRQKADNYAQSLPSSRTSSSSENGLKTEMKSTVGDNTRLRKNSRSIGDGVGELELQSDADDEDSW